MRCLVLLSALTLRLCVWSQVFPTAPDNYVTDRAGLLSEFQQMQLNEKLKAFEDSTSNQIFVYIAPTLEGREIARLSQEIFSIWRIGAKERDNGVLISVFTNDHQFRIHTGYGLEGALPDLLTQRIQTETMRPWFKHGNYYEGLKAGIDSLIYYCRHEYKAASAGRLSEAEEAQLFSRIMYGMNVFALLILLIVLLRKTCKVKEPKYRILLFVAGIVFVLAPGGVILIFALCAVISPRGSGRSGGSSGSSSGSGSSSSSSSSSSFGGGGGGRSGGGGSSSSW